MGAEPDGVDAGEPQPASGTIMEAMMRMLTPRRAEVEPNRLKEVFIGCLFNKRAMNANEVPAL